LLAAGMTSCPFASSRLFSSCALLSLAVAVAVAGCGGSSGTSPPTPGVACTSTEPCDRWDTGAGTVPYFRNLPLLAGSDAVTTAIVVIHGANLKADFSYSNMMSAAQAAGVGAETLVVAPYFQVPAGVDCDGATASPAPADLVWSCGDWKDGGQAANGAATSYDVVDAIVEAIAAPGRFPALERIVIAGHSAGGQFTTRYAALSHTPSAARARYVVANPSSYLYFDDARATSASTCDATGCTGGFASPYFDVADCPAYDQFPYGLENPYGYAVGAASPVATLLGRDVTFLAGDLDVLANATGTDMDTSCSANAQGIDRRTRALEYWTYLRERYGSTAPLTVVPGCEHSESCMFGSAEAAIALFGTSAAPDAASP
jgi:pimeloyl-ACP methyl ester carboxylesterase